MSKATDKALTESMGRRRPREAIQAEVADSVLAELVPPSTIDISLDVLYRSPFQVRAMGNDSDIDRLVESIQSSGLISPVVVRAISNPQKIYRLNLSPSFLLSKKIYRLNLLKLLQGIIVFLRRFA
jgi:hypothetical protein